MATDYLDEALPNNNLRGVIVANYKAAAALPAYTYANGTAGVGATITYNATGAPATIDGQTPALNDILLLNSTEAAAGSDAGVYKCTTLGTVGVAHVWTRATAADTAAKIAGCNVDVTFGTAGANSEWTINLAAASITVGSTTLTFVNPNTSATVPSALGTAATGTSPHLARRDHVHTLPSVDALAATAGALAMANNNITGVKSVILNGEIDDGNSSTSKTIDFSAGPFHKMTLTGNCAITLTAPAGPCVCRLKLTQDGTGSRTISMVTTVLWAGGFVPIPTPTLTTGVTQVFFQYDGSAWTGWAMYGFA